jgi:hypothetical protein
MGDDANGETDEKLPFRDNCLGCAISALLDLIFHCRNFGTDVPQNHWLADPFLRNCYPLQNGKLKSEKCRASMELNYHSAMLDSFGVTTCGTTDGTSLKLSCSR